MHHHSIRRRTLALILLGTALLASPAIAQRRGGGANFAQPEALTFRFMGPAVGNRISAAAGIPGDPTTYYVGAASGGVWKSTDSGQTWVPIFDQQTLQAIGALAVAPSDSRIVWAGTGEAWAIRDSDMMGDGIYKSTDAGATWTHMGLDRDRPHRAHRRASHRPEYRLSPASPDASPGRSRSAASSAPPMAARPGTAFSSSIPTPAAPASRMDPNDPNMLFAGTVAGGDAHLRHVQRRTGQRRLSCRTMAAHTWKRIEGHGLPQVAGRQDRRGHRAQQFQARLRADSDRRPGLALALRRRRRKLGSRQAGSAR